MSSSTSTTVYPIRLPYTLTKSPPPANTAPPSTEWFEGKWYIVHTSLPLWHGKRNVGVTYTRLPSSSKVQKLDDLVTYQAIGSNKVKSVHGIDTPIQNLPGACLWRGKGLLKLTTSHWEILGHGELADGQQWAVTYFAKTPFTAAGFDVYAREKEGLAEDVLQGILSTIVALGSEEMNRLAEKSYAVVMD